jgi:transcriptional regulator with XRE-family HTH domain
MAWKLCAPTRPQMQKSIYSDDYQHLLRELKEVRARANISQEALAASLGEHQTFVSKVERGVRRLDVVELRLWLTALGVSFPEFCNHLDLRLTRHSRLPTGLR